MDWKSDLLLQGAGFCENLPRPHPNRSRSGHVSKTLVFDTPKPPLRKASAMAGDDLAILSVAFLPHAAKGRRIGYARVSTPDQKLDMQIDALERAHCDRIFHDHGVSGAKARRPGLDAALDALVGGDVLVVYRLDRLGRSVQHLADLLEKIDAQGVHFCSLSEGINTATPGGRLVFHVFAAVAQFTRDLIRENTEAGLAAARERGVKLGRPRKLDDAAIRDARRYMRGGRRTLAQTARRFRVSKSTLVRGLCKGEMCRSR